MDLDRNSFKFLIIVILLISIFIYPPTANADPDPDIILKGSDIMTITGMASYDNLSISDEGTLIVENAYLRINGLIRMSDWARFFIFRSTVELTPPPLNDSTRVVHAIDNSVIKVLDGSNLIFNPQPTPTNISYMLLEDESCFIVKDSTFSGDLPSIINQSIEVASVTAGVYLLSGYASWHMINSYVEGTLSLDGGELTGRWFWCSLHQRSSLTIEDTDIQLTSFSESYTLLKPVSGLVTIKDSKILGGSVDVEVIAQAELVNSTFSSIVEFKDQSNAKVSKCTFQKDVTVGSALSMVEVTYNPETNVEILNSTFERNLKCEANSSTYIEDSNLKSLNVKDNASIKIVQSSIESMTNIRDHSRSEIMDSSLGSMMIDDTASLIFDDNQISTVIFYGTGELEEGGITFLRGTYIKNIVIYPYLLYSIVFENLAVGNVSFYNDINITFQCLNTSIDNLKSMRSGENVSMSFIIVNSTTPNLSALNRNITVNIYHRLEVLVELNGEGLETGVIVEDDIGHEWKRDSISGVISFDLPYKFIHNETESITQNYFVKASFLGFSDTKEVVLTSSKTVIFDWEDTIPPLIFNVSLGPKEWNLGKDITIRAVAIDLDIASISSVALFYRIDEGEWSEVQMFKIGDDTYETMIPKQSESCTMTIYVSSEDMAGNVANTELQRLEIGQQENIVYYGGIIALICAISFMVIRRVMIGRKVKRYARKYEFRRNVKK